MVAWKEGQGAIRASSEIVVEAPPSAREGLGFLEVGSIGSYCRCVLTLALSYRPRKFEDVVGQRMVRVVLQQMVKQDKLPSALLFTGSRGCGKTTTARILAAALNCDARPDGPCGACVHCKSIFDGTSPDVIEVDAASNGLIADIRKIREMVLYSVGSEYRVVLLDEAQSMSREAFNALLKTLEEPPPQTVFVLLTTEPAKIIETVISRCMVFEFRRISSSDIVKRLRDVSEQEGLCTVDAGPEYDALLNVIADRANGAMRDGLMMLEQASRVGVTSAEQFRAMVGESDFAPSLLIALMHGDLSVAFEQVQEQMVRLGDPHAVSTALIELIRDLLVIRTGGTIQRQGAHLEARQAIATRLEPERALAAVRVLWDLKTRIRATEDPKAMLDLALVVLSEALQGHSAKASAVAEPSKKLSLAELRASVTVRT